MPKTRTRSQNSDQRKHNVPSLYAASKGGRASRGSRGGYKTGSRRSSSSGTIELMKSTARDILPSAREVKNALPTVLSVGAVALGAIGVFALWKNREKVEAFMEDHDFDVPSFLKSGSSSSISRGSDQIATH